MSWRRDVFRPQIMDSFQRSVRIALRKELESHPAAVVQRLNEPEHCGPIHRACPGFMPAGDVRDVQMTNQSEMLRNDPF